MRNRMEPWFVIVLILMVIGIAYSWQSLLQSLFVPILLVAIVYGLYRFPPNRWRNSSSGRYGMNQRKETRKLDGHRLSGSAKPSKRRASPFTVIEGRKNKDDEPPKYH
jgi:hypothetical protein